MKALSIRQPWAFLICRGFKTVENRTWNTKHRGEILIHASSKYDVEGERWVNEKFPEIIIPCLAVNGMGGIVGVANIIGVTTESRSPWFTGPNGFIFGGAMELPFFRCKGKLGLFEPPPLPPEYAQYLQR